MTESRQVQQAASAARLYKGRNICIPEDPGRCRTEERRLRVFGTRGLRALPTQSGTEQAKMAAAVWLQHQRVWPTIEERERESSTAH